MAHSLLSGDHALFTIVHKSVDNTLTGLNVRLAAWLRVAYDKLISLYGKRPTRVEAVPKLWKSGGISGWGRKDF